jgi:hypothetical protein
MNVPDFSIKERRVFDHSIIIDLLEIAAPGPMAREAAIPGSFWLDVPICGGGVQDIVLERTNCAQA